MLGKGLPEISERGFLVCAGVRGSLEGGLDFAMSVWMGAAGGQGGSPPYTVPEQPPFCGLRCEGNPLTLAQEVYTGPQLPAVTEGPTGQSTGKGHFHPVSSSAHLGSPWKEEERGQGLEAKGTIQGQHCRAK